MTYNKKTMLCAHHAVQTAAAGLMLVLSLAGFSYHATAQTTPPEMPAAKTDGDQARSAEPPVPAGPPASIDGFRGATFGMTEEQVRRAVNKAFPGSGGKLKKTVHPSEKTTVLSLPVTDLVPHTGTARVSYILGYKSKKLIQVNIVWNSDGSGDSDETVVGTANSLRDYFAGQSYKPGSVVANRPLNENGIVVFRGADAEDRLVLLGLNGATAAERKDDKPPRRPPLTLVLSYIADAAHPDVFRIGKGQF